MSKDHSLVDSPQGGTEWRLVRKTWFVCAQPPTVAQASLELLGARVTNGIMSERPDLTPTPSHLGSPLSSVDLLSLVFLSAFLC